MYAKVRTFARSELVGTATQTRWGILGAANIAVERVIPAMVVSTCAVPYAIGSRRLERAQEVAQQFGIAAAYSNYEAVLSDPYVEAVYIPLPNDLHVDWSLRALEAGKHVLCEKPLCLTSAEGRRLIEAQARTGKHLEEALAYRNHPQWERIRQILGDGNFGRPVAVQGTIAKQFMDPADIRNNPAAGGGAANDLGVYVVSACTLVFRRPPLRVAAAIDFDPNFGIDRLTSVMFDYGDAHATFTASSQAGPAGWATHQQLSILCSSGWLRSTFPFAQARPVSSALELGDETSVGGIPTATEIFRPVNQYELQIDRFSCLVQGDNIVVPWPLEDALLSVSIIEAVFRAARDKTWVDL